MSRPRKSTPTSVLAPMPMAYPMMPAVAAWAGAGALRFFAHADDRKHATFAA